ncbi:MAG: ATP-binding cassette domain-containing protein [Bacteriovorax sp.]|jgi:ABC-type polysaccharide/polyol phosphate transport system ATPase subunit
MLNNKKIVLDIQNLKLAFPLRLITTSSVRDVFISTMMGPFSKKYDRNYFLALNDINLKIYEGDRIGLIGVNGSGKSTLCRCISGFYKPQDGKIERKGKIRALFESSIGLYPELSGRENARILAEIYYPEYLSTLDEIISESLDFSELKEFIDAPIKTYSKGMMVRLTLSLLSAKPADLLILDEVFDGADEFFREKLSERIKLLIENSNSVIFVSHYEAQVQSVCNRAILISEGTILHDGDIAKAYAIYRSIKHDQDKVDRK